MNTSPDVEIGRQAALRGRCSQGRAGSSPALGTKNLINSFYMLLCAGFIILHHLYS